MAKKPSKSTAPKRCQACKKRRKLGWFRKQWVCDECMLGKPDPLKLEDYMTRAGPLGDMSRIQQSNVEGISWGSPFVRALDRAIEKHGLNKTQEEMKAEMFAGIVPVKEEEEEEK